jgi:hypothetical protein
MRRSGFRDTDPPGVRRRPGGTSLAICLWLMLAVVHRWGPLTSAFTPIPMGGQRIRTRRGVPPTTLRVTVTPAVLAWPVAAAAIQVLVNALRAVRRAVENLTGPPVSLITPMRGMFITAPVGAWPDTRNGTPIPVASAVHATRQPDQDRTSTPGQQNLVANAGSADGRRTQDQQARRTRQITHRGDLSGRSATFSGRSS